MGWGISAINIASNSLQLANLTIMSDKYCKRSAIGKHYNSELMLCAYAKGRDACKVSIVNSELSKALLIK